MGPPVELIAALRAQRDIREFVETGTFEGHTTAWAAGEFERVTTIELSPEYHARAQARFRDQPQVRVLQGNSAERLREVVPALGRPAIFWLDAHWSGIDTAGREAECPLLAEIAIIQAASDKHIILVDDARYFCAPPPRPHRASEWPDLAATIASLSSQGRWHVALFEDVFIAVPSELREVLAEWLQQAVTRAWNAPRQPWWRKLAGAMQPRGPA